MIHTPPSAVVRVRASRAELEEVAFLAALAAGERERVSRLRELLDSRPEPRSVGMLGVRHGAGLSAPGVRSQDGHPRGLSERGFPFPSPRGDHIGPGASMLALGSRGSYPGRTHLGCAARAGAPAATPKIVTKIA